MSNDLHKFAEKGELKKVKRLLKSRFLRRTEADVNKADLRGRTPLHKAAEKGHTDVAAFLVKHGAKIDAKVKHEMVSPLGPDIEAQGCSPLSFAAKHGHSQVVVLLLKQGADVNVQNYYGWTPLTYAVLKNYIEIVKLLLEYGGDVNIRSAKSGETPLHLCVGWKTRPEIAALLLEHGADVNIQQESGETPLHIAIKWGQTDICAILMEHGADVNIQQQSGETPLDLVAREKRADLATLFGKYVALQGALSEPPVQKDTVEAKDISQYATDNGDGTVTDKRTGLMWQCSEDATERDYEEALTYCQSLDLAGHHDWRLPRKEELAELAAMGFGILKEMFPDIKEERYWAQTIVDELYWAEAPERIAYTIDFDPNSGNYGNPITYFRTYRYYVRAVRDMK